MKLPSSVYDYDVISDSWFLVLKMNEFLAASFDRFHGLEKQKFIETDRPSHVGWPAPREVKSYKKWQLKLKYHLLTKKYYFKESFTFQSKCCILRKVLY